MRLTHSQRQLFRMLANARGPSGRQGKNGPPLLNDFDRMLALRLAGIGDDTTDLIRWPPSEQRDLTREECRAALALLTSESGQQWARRWCYGDSSGMAKIEALVSALKDGAS